jgi:uncharacterized protein
MRGIEYLQKHQVDFNILACVHAANANHPLRVYRFFRDEVDAEFIQFIPIVERQNDSGYQKGTQVTSRSVSGKQYGQFLISIFNEWVRRDVGKIFIQIFDVALGVWYGHPASLCVFKETCGNALAMEHSGDLYSCDHFVEPSFFLGNIQSESIVRLISSDQQIQFGIDKHNKLPQYCKECEVRFACNGGCPKNRVLETPDGEPNLNYLCMGYKDFFTHINEPMKIMANLLRNRRPPAEIMNILPPLE